MMLQWHVGELNMLMLLRVLVSSAANRAGQVMLCCQVSDGKSLFRDFGVGNCRKLSAMGFYLHFIRMDCEGQRHETHGWSSRSHRQSAVEPRSDPGSGVAVNSELGAPEESVQEDCVWGLEPQQPWSGDTLGQCPWSRDVCCPQRQWRSRVGGVCRDWSCLEGGHQLMSLHTWQLVLISHKFENHFPSLAISW